MAKRKEQAKEQPKEQPVGLMVAEHIVLGHLVKAWEAFTGLDHRFTGPSDIDAFSEAISSCQRLVGMRVARRAEPGFWMAGRARK